MNDNPRRLWPWVAVPVLYVLGFGPAVWLAARGSVHPMVVKFVYWPLLCQRVHLTNTLGPALAWYGSLGIPRGESIVFEVGDLEGETISASFGDQVVPQ